MDYKGHIGNYIVPEDTKNGICVDIGANYGNFIEKYNNHFKEIHYVEALKHVYDSINEKFKNHTNVFGNNRAAWSKSNIKLKMVSHINNDAGSAGIQGEFINDDWTNNILNEVLSISIEELVDKLGKIDYLKIDCETSEYPFLFEKDLNNFKYIAIELHHQMGIVRYNNLIDWIKKTHNLIHGDDTYKFDTNKEVLYMLK